MTITQGSRATENTSAPQKNHQNHRRRTYLSIVSFTGRGVFGGYLAALNQGLELPRSYGAILCRRQ
jgi:hypothetical protein